MAEFGTQKPALHLISCFTPLPAFMRLLKCVFFCTAEEFELVLHGSGNCVDPDWENSPTKKI